MKKLLIVLLLLLTFTISYSQTEKLIDTTMFKKMDVKHYLRYDGEILRNTYWLEGGGFDINKDSIIERKTIICKLEKKPTV